MSSGVEKNHLALKLESAAGGDEHQKIIILGINKKYLGDQQQIIET